MPDQFVTIGRFSLLSEAQAVKSRLETNNIPAWIIDDSVGGSLPGLGDTIGGIVLRVQETDHDRTEAILAELLGEGEEDRSEDARAWTCIVCAEEVNGDFDTCPSCGATKESLQTRPPSQPTATPIVEEQENEAATPIGQVVTSRSLRSVVVALLVGPALLGSALLILGLILLLLFTLFGPPR